MPRQRIQRQRGVGRVPVAGLSIFDPIFLGIDENGYHVTIELAYRNLLVAGEPGAGKSVFVQNILGHASQCADVQLWLFDGKRLELGMWTSVADVSVGPDLGYAIAALRWLQQEIDRRTEVMLAAGVRKLVPAHQVEMILCVVDEIAFYSATAGDKQQREEFVIALRDVVARGRAVGIMVVGATQRPSADIIPTSLRDIFGYRCAFRCTTPASSDIVLGVGWAQQGYNAMDIAPEDVGVGWLLAEGGKPRRFRSAFLSDSDIDYLADQAAYIRHLRTGGTSGSGTTGSTDGGAA